MNKPKVEIKDGKVTVYPFPMGERPLTVVNSAYFRDGVIYLDTNKGLITVNVDDLVGQEPELNVGDRVVVN